MIYVKYKNILIFLYNCTFCLQAMDEMCGEKPWIEAIAVAGSHISDTSEETTDESLSNTNSKKGKYI